MFKTSVVALILACTATALHAQQRADAQASACWRFSFGDWSPPLDWSKAGHPGQAEQTAALVKRIRDSVYVKDSGAVNNNAMTWERNEHGLLLILYPAWWPAGVTVTFDSSVVGEKEMIGTATAMVGNGSDEPPRTRAHAWQRPC